MAASLTELLRDANKRQEMGRKGRRLAEERFSIEVGGRPTSRSTMVCSESKQSICLSKMNHRHSWERHENILRHSSLPALDFGRAGSPQSLHARSGSSASCRVFDVVFRRR